MDLYSFPPIAALLEGAYTVASSLAELLTPIVGTASVAVAIVIITTVVRAALLPAAVAQVRAEATRRKLAPMFAEVRRRYGKNPELMQRKTLELYKETGTSPLAGILPTLVQAPVISIIYALFILGNVAGHSNALLAAPLFEVPLGSSLVHFLGGTAVWPGVAVFAALLVIIAVVATFSRRLALSQAMPPADPGLPAAARLAGILSWLPFITVIFAALVPLAATLYLAVSTSWTLVERTVLRRRLL
ncbi:MAG: preprotein translocase YidC [Glaciihabitans sp.]|nr:preprotein translocase YidC [Glaciihabitans sp.]